MTKNFFLLDKGGFDIQSASQYLVNVVLFEIRDV